jgi:hypothetical protein
MKKILLAGLAIASVVIIESCGPSQVTVSAGQQVFIMQGQFLPVRSMFG